jgi:undecaprenyl-diphosphatase
MLPLLTLNGATFELLNDDIAGRFSVLDNLMKFSAQYLIYVLALVLVASWFVHVGGSEQRRLAVYTAVASAALAIVVGWILQQWYVHPRPFVARSPGEYVLLVHHAADASFPSDHATAAFAIAFGALFYRPRLGAILLVLAVIIAFSRVYVGLHYPGDVLGGAGVGILAAIVVRFARPVFIYLDDLIVVRLVPAPLR